MNEIERAAIGWATTQLVYRAAALTDVGAWEELATLYAEDATLARPSDPGKKIVGRTAILAAARARQPRRSRHLVSNPLVDVYSIDEVSVTSTLTLFTGPSAGAEPVDADPLVAIGQSIDHIRRIDGAWRFVERSGSMTLRYRPAV